MRGIRVWARLLGLARAVVEDVWIDDAGAVIVAARPWAREQGRCGICRRRCPGYDRGEGRRRWRALDLATTRAFVQADAPRVQCRRHGVIVAAVPWARHDSSFTRAFEDQCAWLAVNTSASAVAALMRTTWRTVGWICARVSDEARAQRDLLGGLRRIGFDEISVRKGQTYLTVVVDQFPTSVARRSAGGDRRRRAPEGGAVVDPHTSARVASRSSRRSSWRWGYELVASQVDVQNIGAVSAREWPDVALVGLGDSSQHALELIDKIVREATCLVIVLTHARDPDFLPDIQSRCLLRTSVTTRRTGEARSTSCYDASPHITAQQEHSDAAR